MKQKTKGSLIIDLLIATMIAGIAISVAARLPVMLVKLWQKVTQKINQKTAQQRVVNLLINDFQTALIPELYVPKIEFSVVSKENLDKKDKNPPQEEVTKNKNLKKWFFMAKNESSTQDFLFFVTTNLIPTFTITKQKIAGVFYVLEKISESLFEKNINLRNLKEKKLCRLVRIESTDFLNIDDDFSSEKLKQISGKRIVILPFVEQFDIEMSAWCKIESNSKLDEKTKDENSSATQIELKKVKKWPIKGITQYSLPAKIKINCKYLNPLLEEEVFEIEEDVFAQYVLTETKSPQDLENERKSDNSSDDSIQKRQINLEGK